MNKTTVNDALDGLKIDNMEICGCRTCRHLDYPPLMENTWTIKRLTMPRNHAWG